jgi:S-formylglutathione hydrolase FrmB
MRTILHRHHLFILCIVITLLAGCDEVSLAPFPTPTQVVIVVTAEPSATPTATTPPTATPTQRPSPTPEATATATIIPCVAEGGQVFQFDDFRSESARETINYRVYIPPCYVETQRRYPLVFLLPGLGEDEAQWEELGVARLLDESIVQGSLPPMIVVMPELGNVGVENDFPPDPSYEGVILNELLPIIERDFCSVQERAFRAIGGISRGGFWAYSIALRNPDVFSIVGGHSAFFDPDNAPSDFNPLDLALNSDTLASADLRMYLDNAAIDFVGTNQQLFSSRLSSRGIPHQYIINPTGDHNDDYWSSHVPEYLAFYGRDFPRDSAALPSCAS